MATALRLDGWFAVASGVESAAPKAPPQGLVADCLLTAVLACPHGSLLPILFRRLAAPLLWPKVCPLPTDDCYYRIKFEQVGYQFFCVVCFVV